MVRKQTRKRRKYSGSPTFSKTNSSSIGAGEPFGYNFDENDSRADKYVPFDFLQVINRSDQPIEVRINGDTSRVIPLGAKQTISAESDVVKGIRFLTVVNQGGAQIPADKVELTVQKQPLQTDKAVRLAAESVLGL